MIRICFGLAAAAPLPAFAASGPFFSLGNTDFVVAISFVIFVGTIIYLKAPQFAGKLLDGRINEICVQIDRAADLCAEATASLDQARIEAKEAEKQAERIVEHAADDARRQIADAEIRIKETGDRRIQAASEQIASAERAARSAVYREAVDMAVDAAAREIAAKMTDSERSRMTDQAMQEIRANMQ